MMFTSSASSTAPPPTAYGLRQLPWMWSPGAQLKTDAVEEQQQEQEEEEDGDIENETQVSKVQPRLPLLWFPRFGWSVKEINEVQIRRDLALKPTVEDPDTERRVVPFVNSRGQTIFTQSWTPAAPDHSIKGLLVLIHGLNEHSGRYAEFAIQLNSQGYGVFGMDWIGHGGSDGLHGYVQALDHVVSDVKEYYRRVAAEYPGIPCFLFGHSTGGAIALKVLIIFYTP
jgi:acylglycerol lipase